MTQTRHDPSDTLTERYVHAVVRRLPEDQRTDVAGELRATLADRLDALAEERPDLSDDAAERVALEELGDPERLSADYAGRRLVLIGPDLFPTYIRLLRSLLVTVVPIVVVVLAVVSALEEDSVGAIIGTTIWTGFTVAVHIAFWVTLAFAVAERGGSTATAEPWSPDQLPRVAAGRASLGECFGTIAWLGVAAGALVWQQVRSPIDAATGERLPLIDPDLWSFWLPLVLVLIAVEAAYEVVKYRAGGVNPAANVLVGAVFTLPLAYLAFSERLLNPAAVTEIQRSWDGFDPGVAHLVVGISLVAIWLWDGVEGWLHADRAAQRWKAKG